MKPNQNFLALDLELNQPSNKIIQVGITIGNRKQIPVQYFKTNWIVNPNEPLRPDIVELTGITEERIVNEAKSLADIAEEIKVYINHYDCFVNPVTWGGGDSLELLQEFADADIHFPCFGRRWIDVKTIHQYLQIAEYKNPKASLRSALARWSMKFDGRQHDAGDDAYNTLKLFFFLLDRQDKINYSKNILSNVK